MRYFRNSEGVIHAYDVDGHQDKLIDAAIKAGWPEVPGPDAEAAPDQALAKIRELEATVTPRRLRESILGIDGGWLKALDAQIDALRSK
jgi:hypothetical protein